MDQRTRIEQAINAYIEGTNTNDTSLIPLTADVVLKGPMIPEPLQGETAVREHLGATAPFVARMELKELLIDGDRASFIIEFEGVNGVRLEGMQYFRFRDGAICEDRAYFDTAVLMRGRQS